MKINLISFNIQSCRDYVKRDFNPLLMTETIKSLHGDIIGLNEVRNEGPDENFINQPKIIAEALGYQYYYFGKALDLNNGPYGNALISKYPIDEIETIMIPDPPVKDEDAYYETRCIIKARILNFTLIITHIGLANAEKINAINTLTNIIDNTSGNIILMGDFNMQPDNIKLIPLKDRLIDTSFYFEKPLLSFPSINPVKKIDYIFTSSTIKIIRADIPQITASDHYPYLITIDI